MSGTLTLWLSTKESVEVPIKTTVDPTGTVPQFSLSDVTSTTPGTFYSGTWKNSFDGEWTTAVTPTMGDHPTGATIHLTSGSTYLLWAKITVGTEVAVWPVGKIVCP